MAGSEFNRFNKKYGSEERSRMKFKWALNEVKKLGNNILDFDSTGGDIKRLNAITWLLLIAADYMSWFEKGDIITFDDELEEMDL